MKRILWVALGTLLAAMPGVHAQQPTRMPDPADPAVAVPPVDYVSAMTGYTPVTKDGTPPPDKAWRAANAAVGGHAGDDSHAGHAGHVSHAPAPASTQAPSRPVPATAPAGHHKHH